jgi:RNA polymerase sigma factor (sigma-70 family)
MRTPLLFLNSDAKILDLMRQNNEAALVELFEANQRMVVSFVTANRGTQDDAEDLLQEAVVVVWQRVRAGTYEHTAKLSTYIFGIVKHLWMRRLARMRRECPMALTEEAATNDDPSILEQLIESEQAQAVVEALRRLGEPCRTLLRLFYWEEMPNEEIAQQMDFANADVVKSKKYQCKKSLEAILRKNGFSRE